MKKVRIKKIEEPFIRKVLTFPPLTFLTQEHLEKYEAMSDQYHWLECDGFSKVLAYEMISDGYQPEIKIGKVLHDDKILPYHHWVIVNNHTIDFRLRMWFGNNAPHGEILRGVEYYALATAQIPSKTLVDILKTNYQPITIN